MKPDKIVFEGKTESGLSFFLRYPKPEDLEKLLKFINTLSKEQTFINHQGEQFTLEQQKADLEGWLKGMSEKKSISVLAFVNEQLIGSSGINLYERMGSHVGSGPGSQSYSGYFGDS